LISDKVELEDFAEAFEEDEMLAMRDYASIPGDANQPFFPNPDMLDTKGVDNDHYPVDPDSLVIQEWFTPLEHAEYVFAGDLSVSGDRTGLAFGHYDWLRNKVVLDFTLAIKVPRGSTVDYGPIKSLIYGLTEKGFRISGCVFDQFQSHDFINQLRSQGYNARVVQFADSLQGCGTVRDMLLNNRFDFNKKHEKIFIGEAKELQVVNSKRVDHQKTTGYYNSKDVWDAVVNMTVELIEIKKKASDTTDFILPTSMVTDAFQFGNMDMSQFSTSKMPYMIGLGIARRESVLTASARLPDGRAHVFLAKVIPFVRITQETTGFIKTLMEEFGTTTVMTETMHDYAYTDLTSAGIQCARLNSDKVITNGVEAFAHFISNRRVSFNQTLRSTISAPLANFHRDATGRVNREGAAVPISVILSTVMLPEAEDSGVLKF
jgi:hypothetical protein